MHFIQLMLTLDGISTPINNKNDQNANDTLNILLYFQKISFLLHLQ